MSETHLQIDDKAIAPLSRHQAKPFPANLAEISGVTKCFGYKTALRNVSFSVPAGQICGLLGPNGAGKTTLFRLLMGILGDAALGAGALGQDDGVVGVIT